MRIRSEHTRHDPTPPLDSDRPALAGTAVRERKNRHKEAERPQETTRVVEALRFVSQLAPRPARGMDEGLEALF